MGAGRLIGIAVLAGAAFAAPLSAAEAPRAPDRAWAYLASLPKAERQAVLEREARADGSLVIYGGTGLDRLQFWVDQFHRHYPDIKIDFVRLLEDDLAQRAITEARAGRPTADILLQTTSYLTVLKGLAAPYEPAEWEVMDPRFRYGSAQEGWVAVAYETFPEAIAWRTDRVSAAEAPKSLDALADPRWKGRVGTTVHIERLISGLVQTYGKAGMPAKLEALAALDNRLYNSHAALSDALAQGEVDIAWDLIASRPMGLKAKGAPVDWVFMDPLYGESNAILLMKDTKKPYAAALFADVLLSRETLEASDRWDPSRLFGNTTGKYTYEIDQLPNLVLFPPVDAGEVKAWSQMKERLFVRRQ